MAEPVRPRTVAEANDILETIMEGDEEPDAANLSRHGEEDWIEYRFVVDYSDEE